MSKKEYSNKQETMFKIELVQAFVERFGLKSNIVLRIAEELATILADFPFTAVEIQTVSKQLPAVEHVYFHGNNEVDVSVVEKLAEEFLAEDKVFVGKREIYFLSAQSSRNSKLETKLIKLDESFTVRN